MTDEILRNVGVDIFEQWTMLWNQSFHLADKIMAPHFILHYAQAASESMDNIHHPQELVKLIEAWHQQRPGIVYKADCEAVVDLTMKNGLPAGMIARPYLVTFLGDDNQLVRRSGTDILRIVDGKIAEVWSVSGGVGGRTF